jgi:hypothetical protein
MFEVVPPKPGQVTSYGQAFLFCAVCMGQQLRGQRAVPFQATTIVDGKALCVMHFNDWHVDSHA